MVEGGVTYYVRVDHIGRPVFATDSVGTIVWNASYLPFGEVLATTGTPMELRFPGQWFQAESGLHQNWMRDYDPTTGRYMQADPLGLIPGPSLYGYAYQNPSRYIDPTGENPVIACLVSPWCRAAAGAAASMVYGYFPDEDGCYTWEEAAGDAAIGAAISYGGGRGLRPILNRRVGGLFGRDGRFNSGYTRIGWGRHKGDVFRISRGHGRRGRHFDIYRD